MKNAKYRFFPLVSLPPVELVEIVLPATEAGSILLPSVESVPNLLDNT